jgi:hypothetical protein
MTLTPGRSTTFDNFSCTETGQHFLEGFEAVRHLRRGGAPGGGHLVPGRQPLRASGRWWRPFMRSDTVCAANLERPFKLTGWRLETSDTARTRAGTQRLSELILRPSDSVIRVSICLTNCRHGGWAASRRGQSPRQATRLRRAYRVDRRLYLDLSAGCQGRPYQRHELIEVIRLRQDDHRAEFSSRAVVAPAAGGRQDDSGALSQGNDLGALLGCGTAELQSDGIIVRLPQSRC